LYQERAFSSTLESLRHIEQIKKMLRLDNYPIREYFQSKKVNKGFVLHRLDSKVEGWIY
jgi:hypothetical protein